MFKPTVDAASDAASVLFNLPEYRVLAVTRDERGGREVFIETLVSEAGCPSCGVVTARVHQRTMQRVRDVPFDGQVTVWWVKKRWRCGESLCGKATFTEHTDQVPPYARLTTRLKERIVTALSGEVRCVDAVAAELGVSWPTDLSQVGCPIRLLYPLPQAVPRSGPWYRPRNSGDRLPCARPRW